MRARPAAGRPLAAMIAVLVVSGGTAGLGTAEPAAAEGETTIVVGTSAARGPASTSLLGVNHRYNADGYGLWNTRLDRPATVYVDGAVKAGIESLRFPGGTIANTYEWKRAIGEDRGCQIDGRGSATTGFGAVDHGLSFGPDEFMASVAEIGAEPLVMVPFVRETAQDAADWVEYMNSPAGDGVNPNGGVDWAEVRAANGHPEPYAVQRWEIGNEHHHLDSRHWMSSETATAAQQYAFGGDAWYAGEPLGKGCRHPVEGVASDGTERQAFQVMYPPVDPATVQVQVQANGKLWRQVPDVSLTRPRARVYEVHPESGEIVFGDGTHGRVPKEGKQFLASYDSVHEGYFAFAEAMKAVDPSIDVCASFGRVVFLQTVEGQQLDCLTTHPITGLGGPGDQHADWVDALEGHDRLMVAVAKRKRGVFKLLRSMPEGTPLWFTEAAAVRGDKDAFPRWASSASQAAFMASMWGDWMRLGIQFAMSSVFLGGDRAVLGRHAAFSAEAVTRQAIKPMFSAGGEVLPAHVEGNPVRAPEGFERSYDALAVTATREPDGSVDVMVVNRLPEESVTSQVAVEGLVPGSAEVRQVVSDHFTDANTVSSPDEVRLESSTVPAGEGGLVLTFPPASTTVLRLPPPA